MSYLPEMVLMMLGDSFFILISILFYFLGTLGEERVSVLKTTGLLGPCVVGVNALFFTGIYARETVLASALVWVIGVLLIVQFLMLYEHQYESIWGDRNDA